MNVFTFVFLTVTVVLVAQLIKSYLENRNKRNAASEEADDDTLFKIDRLEERIEVLERIVTENRYDLKKQIDNL
ncbi:MAG TPA: hypothetical protein VNQ14_11010 [Woeseiaceae bacterium]|nr:hypothetical protein [Woeseiaceae bacterium]